MVGQGGVDVVDLLVAQLGGEVDARDDRADARSHQCHLYGGIAHAVVSPDRVMRQSHAAMS
jgi:hypothetical protein